MGARCHTRHGPADIRYPAPVTALLDQVIFAGFALLRWGPA